MTNPKPCCGHPPLIFTGTSALGKPVNTVVCLFCGRSEISGDKEIAVIRFNKVKRADDPPRKESV